MRRPRAALRWPSPGTLSPWHHDCNYVLASQLESSEIVPACPAAHCPYCSAGHAHAYVRARVERRGGKNRATVVDLEAVMAKRKGNQRKGEERRHGRGEES